MDILYYKLERCTLLGGEEYFKLTYNLKNLVYNLALRISNFAVYSRGKGLFKDYVYKNKNSVK